VSRRTHEYDSVVEDVPGDASGWLFFCALLAAVGKLFSEALSDTRAAYPTVLVKLSVDGAAADYAASFHVRIGDATVRTYMHDTSLALYTVIELGRVAGRPTAEAVPDGWTVPQESLATVTAAPDADEA